MNPVLDSEISSADMGEAGAAGLSASGKRACNVAALASARILVEDFGPFIFATTSSSCSTEAMNARMVDTSSACRNFSSPCDVQQTFSFAGRSTSQDNPDALHSPGPDAVELPCRRQRYRNSLHPV